MRSSEIPKRKTPRVLGLDDFAWKKGDRYGTLLKETEALRLITDVPVVASSERKFACGAGSAGSLRGEGETFCDEAGTKVL